ncbi:type IV pilus twitching motility protein PilT [Fusobacterium sp. MFO224]|uniref:type IV pilus twitching motility protein PilT n=1 Tax=Fusobacterium sp. MFO224 TaxID=3378070 RepID=UPI0038545516
MTEETFFKIIKKGREIQASDIHLLVGEVPVLRVNGNLIKIENYSFLSKEDMKQILEIVLSKEKKSELELKREVDLSIKDKDGSCRLNIFYEKDKISIVIRIIKENIPSLKALNINDKIYDFLDLKQGLLIIAGKSGSGKSTTIASIIEEFNKNKAYNILTIEDPIEYIFENKKSIIRQREIGKDVVNFSSGIRSSLRQDADIIMVGELRDLESIEMAITGAETGHLVISTLHTTGSVDTIDRIISTFSTEKKEFIQKLLATNLIGVIYQEFIENINQERTTKVPLCEMMYVNKGISNLIRTGRTNQISSFIEVSGRKGILNKKECLKFLYRNSKINNKTYEEYLKKIRREETL